MKLANRLKWLVGLAVALFLVYRIFGSSNLQTDTKNFKEPFRSSSNITRNHIRIVTDAAAQVKEEIVNIAIVSCGERLHETLNVIKSALMFTKTTLRFLLICDEDAKLSLSEKLSDWQAISNKSFSYRMYPLTFPKEDEKAWKKLFKLCASQRLFLPELLSDIDSVLYVDTDTVFLAPPEQVWRHFDRMNSSQLAALTAELEDANICWYNRFARHPYYGPYGVNSGVMLMNLTRMREFRWNEYVIPVYKTYKLEIAWGDQDIINIMFYYHPDKLYVYPCEYNYRPDHCMHMSICKTAETEGVVVLHGSRGYFHSNKQPIFGHIFKAFLEYEMGRDSYSGFYLPLQSYLESSSPQTNCDKVKHAFLKNIRKHIQPHDDLNL